MNTFLIGIDEAGRGPLAGPVALGLCAVSSPKILKLFKGVKDSKQLSEAQREEWFVCIKAAAKTGDLAYVVTLASNTTIDTKGLSWAIKSALARGLKRLEKKGVPCASSQILLDGSLYAPKKYTHQKTIIGGDASQPIIALASICAKVTRDRLMKRKAKEFPPYGFEIHKGYGTKAHYTAIKRHGFSPIHRRSFLTSRLRPSINSGLRRAKKKPLPK